VAVGGVDPAQRRDRQQVMTEVDKCVDPGPVEKTVFIVAI